MNNKKTENLTALNKKQIEMRKYELEGELKILEHQLKFSRFAIKGGVWLCVGLMIVSLVALGLGAYTLVKTGHAIFDGTSKIGIALLAIPAAVIYFAFAMGREASIHLRMEEKTEKIKILKELEMRAGKRA